MPGFSPPPTLYEIRRNLARCQRARQHRLVHDVPRDVLSNTPLGFISASSGAPSMSGFGSQRDVEADDVGRPQ